MKTLAFKSSRAFRTWLEKNHGRAEGILLRIYKKDSGAATRRTTRHDRTSSNAFELELDAPSRVQFPFTLFPKEVTPCPSKRATAERRSGFA